MANFIIFLDRVVNLYLYYVIMACFLAIIPNINMNYPLFDFIFKSAGFYLIPPFLGVSFSPMIMLTALVLISQGLRKIYIKYYADKEPPIIILTKDEFEKKFNLDTRENETVEGENSKTDKDVNNNDDYSN